MLVTCAGILVADIIASGLPKVSDPGEVTIAPSGISLNAGGHSANVSIDLIGLGLERGTVSCVGALGNDALGDFIIKELERHGVITHIERVDKAPTASNMILVVRGEDRRFHVDAGANQFLDPRMVRETLRKDGPSIFYVGATGHLGQFDEQLPRLLREAKEELNCLTFVDPVQPHGHGWEYFLRSLEWVDVLHCNNVEAEGITGKRSPTEALDAIADQGVKLAIVTLGNRGLLARRAHDRITLPAFKITVVDPTGAGDAFSAGVIHYLTSIVSAVGQLDIASLTRKQLLELLLEGEAAGAACVTGIGTTSAVTRENVNRILAEQREMVMQRLGIGSGLF